jgi:hypothetical protein
MKKNAIAQKHKIKERRGLLEMKRILFIPKSSINNFNHSLFILLNQSNFKHKKSSHPNFNGIKKSTKICV